MAKKEDNNQEQLQEQEQTASPAKAGGQSPVDALITNGTVTIEAPTRDALFSQAEEIIKALPEGVQAATGAVGYSVDTQTYTLRIDVV